MPPRSILSKSRIFCFFHDPRTEAHTLSITQAPPPPLVRPPSSPSPLTALLLIPFVFIFFSEGMMERDSRVVERKKSGLKKARKAPQWVKR